MILLDTNLLLRIVRSTDPKSEAVRTTIHNYLVKGERLIIVPQNIFEFWAVATRAAGMPPTGSNGLGMTVRQAERWISFFQRRFTFLPDREEVTALWRALVVTHQVSGFRAHDMRLVAAMQSYGITQLLTLNDRDFRNLPITVIDPLQC
jgi:predicted nucleic acid-binding protein